MSTPLPSVTIAVLTYLRPEDIQASLPALVDQAARYPGEASVLVVDNDPQGSARSTVEPFTADRVSYVVEPTPGIAAARNRALAECDTDLLVFIDDDERPTPDWLRLLVDTYLAHPGTLGVLGLVESEFSSTPDPWIVAGRFFERLCPPTGTEIFVVSTNNLLLDRGLLERESLRFDERFGLSGGSDTLFSHEARRRGLSFRFCAEALVLDAVPPERMTREWALNRTYRMGNSWSRTLLAVTPPGPGRLVTRLRLTAAGAARVAFGAVRALAGRLTGSASWHAQGHRTLRRGAGIAAGAWGHAYEEYARPVSP